MNKVFMNKVFVNKVSLKDPRVFLAFGFGSGLAPKAPGTFGTLAALPCYLLFAFQPLLLYSAIVLLAALLGIWLCDRASAAIGAHDHPGIVWDEFVGLWIALWAVPVEPLWILAGFTVFRVFDIIKPWPINWLDRHCGGGFGIMIDDVAAGALACVTLHGALYLGRTV